MKYSLHLCILALSLVLWSSCQSPIASDPGSSATVTPSPSTTPTPLPSTTPPSSLANLKALTSSFGTLSPVFQTSNQDYTLLVPSTVSSVVITGTAADAKASVTPAVTLGSLVAGIPQTAVITVTAADGITTKAYNVVATRAAAPALTISITGFPDALNGSMAKILCAQGTTFTYPDASATGTISGNQLTLPLLDQFYQERWTGSTNSQYVIKVLLTTNGVEQPFYFSNYFYGGNKTESFLYSNLRKYNGGLELTTGVHFTVGSIPAGLNGCDVIVESSQSAWTGGIVARQTGTIYGGALVITMADLQGKGWNVSGPYYLFLRFPHGEVAGQLYFGKLDGGAQGAWFPYSNSRTYAMTVWAPGNKFPADVTTLSIRAASAPSVELAHLTLADLPANRDGYPVDAQGAYWVGDPAVTYEVWYQTGGVSFRDDDTFTGGVGIFYASGHFTQQ